jgi:hypothetical protein
MARHERRAKGRPKERGGPRAEAAQDDAATGAWLAELAEIARDPVRRAALQPDELLLVTFQQCLWYGHSQDAEITAVLAGLYADLVARAAEADRLELLDRVAAAVEDGGTTVLALLPFLLHENAPEAVAIAAETFASLMPLEGADELTGPRTLLRLLEHAEDEGTRVGLAAALLRFGDRRLRPLLDEAWRRLDPAARMRLVASRGPSRVLFAASVEFWMGCLEDADTEVFGAIAGELERAPRQAEPARVLDVRRKFPANASDDRDEIALEGDWPLEAYAAQLAPALRDLARRENEPRRMPAVLAAWGIGPDATPGPG